ncbi:Growth-regulating factor 1 [Camellia lanceoleosa]|uniref:Growth-regulating factor 1 n=1 Tax=Camellia lanceoleosa TaxID=1840588 RepID=A0ACC0H5U3_9ERIC|nr:Growth-regulating factor 1 [Camellia lanceoleosa]
MKCRDQLHELVKEEIEKKDSSTKEWKIAMERSFNRMDNEIPNSKHTCAPSENPLHSVWWGSFEMGYGIKVDPEPGRCRRIDGKKWRCSKEAHPDSKYCERHMHRGTHRLRKPMEVITTITTNSSSIPPRTNPNSAGAAATTTSIISYSLSAESYPFLNPHSSSSRPPGFFFFFFITSNYVHGVRDEVDSRAPFPEASGTPLTTSSSNSAYSQLGFHKFHRRGKSREQQQQQHCFVLGSDFRSGKPMEVEREEKQKPFHHLFGE